MKANGVRCRALVHQVLRNLNETSEASKDGYFTRKKNGRLFRSPIVVTEAAIVVR
jgi:hypothetical protein